MKSATLPVKPLTFTEQHDRHDFRDLVAQETMAQMAIWMLVAALLTFLITSIGTWLIWRQISLTRMAVEETAKATEAMHEANEIARRAGIEQIAIQRPILQLDVDSYEMWAHPRESRYNDANLGPFEIPVEGMRLKFDVKNFGNQPCWIDAIWHGFFVSTDESPTISPDQMLQFRGPTAGFVLPGQSFAAAGAIYKLPPADLDLLNISPRGIAIFGAIQYRNASGHIFCSRFAFHANLGDGRDRLHPISVAEHWRDGRIKAVKMDLSDTIEFLDSNYSDHNYRDLDQ